MSQKLRFAIIGCGKIAPRHAAEATKQGTLVAVCDIIKERVDSLAAAHSAKAYRDLSDLLEKETIDVVAVCTPNGLHTAHSIACLKAGCHVLCEKPLSISSADAKKMVDTANKNNKKLFVVKSTRHNPVLSELKRMISENELGNLYSFQLNCFWNRPPAYYKDSWKGNLEMDGGTLYTQFSHYIDALLWLLGDVETVVGFRKNIAHKNIIDFEDSGTVSLQMKNGMLGGLNWSVNTFEKNLEVSLTLIAEKASIRVGGEYMNKLEYQLTSGVEWAVPETGTPNDYGFYKGSMSHHDKIYENLVKALQDDTHVFANAADGLKTVETIEKIYNSVSLS